MYVPLCVRSAFSIHVGASTVGALVRRAASLGLNSLALTDVNNLYGAVKFTKAAQEVGIRPLLGAMVSTDTESAVCRVVRDDTVFLLRMEKL